MREFDREIETILGAALIARVVWDPFPKASQSSRAAQTTRAIDDRYASAVDGCPQQGPPQILTQVHIRGRSRALRQSCLRQCLTFYPEGLEQSADHAITLKLIDSQALEQLIMLHCGDSPRVYLDRSVDGLEALAFMTHTR
jgi:hypothetical protein